MACGEYGAGILGARILLKFISLQKGYRDLSNPLFVFWGVRGQVG